MSVADVDATSNSTPAAGGEGVTDAENADSAQATAEGMFRQLSSVQAADRGDSTSDPNHIKIGAPKPVPGEDPAGPGATPTTQPDPADKPPHKPAHEPTHEPPQEPPPPDPDKIG